METLLFSWIFKAIFLNKDWLRCFPFSPKSDVKFGPQCSPQLWMSRAADLASAERSQGRLGRRKWVKKLFLWIWSQTLFRVTPLMFACINNHSHAAHELLAAGADITKWDKIQEMNKTKQKTYSLQEKHKWRHCLWPGSEARLETGRLFWWYFMRSIFGSLWIVAFVTIFKFSIFKHFVHIFHLT